MDDPRNRDGVYPKVLDESSSINGSDIQKVQDMVFKCLHLDMKKLNLKIQIFRKK